MDNLDRYDNLLKLITEEVEIDGKKYLLRDEFDKFFIKGNRTAATRIRKFMQLIKNESQQIRENVQTYRKSLK